MTRLYSPRGLVPLVVLILLAPVAAGQVAAYDTVDGVDSADEPSTSGLTSTGTVDAGGVVTGTAQQSLSGDEGSEDGSGQSTAPGDDPTQNTLDLSALDRDRQSTDASRSTIVGSDGLINPVVLTGELGGSDGASDPRIVDPTAPDDADVGVVGGTPRSGGHPARPGGQPDDGLPVTVGVSGLALAAAVRRGALLGGAALLSPYPAFETGRSALDRLVRLVYPLRYSKYDDSDPLDHDTRRRVHDVVEADPGTYLSAVSERAGVPLSTARHHVRILEREGMLASAKVRGKRRFYPSGANEVELAAAIDDGATASVLDALARLGPCSVAVLADELGRDSSTVTYHLQRLEEDGLVERERDGRSVVNRLSEAGRTAFAPEGAERPAARAVTGPADD